MEIKIHDLDRIQETIINVALIIVVTIIILVLIKEIGKWSRLRILVPKVPPDKIEDIIEEQVAKDVLDTDEKNGEKNMKEKLETVCGAKKKT